VAERAVDEIDFFALVYRQRYKVSRPWPFTQARSIGVLYNQPTSANEFHTCLSALADLLDHLNPPKGYEKDAETGKDAPRLLALQRLVEDDYPQRVEDVRKLRAIRDARAGWPVHSRQERLPEIMKNLGIDYPAVDWGLAWHRVLGAFWSSLRALRTDMQASIFL
jgi:hypothetical protein